MKIKKKIQLVFFNFLVQKRAKAHIYPISYFNYWCIFSLSKETIDVFLLYKNEE